MSIRISTGPVRAAGYADKLRRVLIAATKNRGVPVEEAIRVAAYINQQLFKIMRNSGVNKDDVVRILFEIDILDGKIGVNWRSIRIEVFKPVEEFLVSGVGVEIPKEAPEVTEEEVRKAIAEAEKPEEEGEIKVIEEKKEKGVLSRLIEKIKSIFRH